MAAHRPRPAPPACNSLEVADRSGHLTLTWSPADPADCARARAEVEALRAAGYTFFGVEDEADPVAGEAGVLSVRRVDAVVTDPPAVPEEEIEEEPEVPVSTRSKKGAAHSKKGATKGKGKRFIALPRMAGG